MLTRILQEQIQRNGPMPFREFQNSALYHPQFGYYRRGNDPFGIHGDFYTAEQLQPVFGMLIERVVRRLAESFSPLEPFQIVELGAGRCEMQPYLKQWNYTAIDNGFGQLPETIRGVVFANEFFDALPVSLVRRHGNQFIEVRVGWDGESFHFCETEPARDELESYLTRHAPVVEDGGLIEIHLDAVDWIDRLGCKIEEGFVFIIDYGFNERERLRFPEGTLMSYWRHQAMEDVLTAPGTRDITSHVPFTVITREAEWRGFKAHPLQSLAQLLLTAGEADHFDAVLNTGSVHEQQARRQQLKTLLYGMGETFRVLALEVKSKAE